MLTRSKQLKEKFYTKSYFTNIANFKCGELLTKRTLIEKVLYEDGFQQKIVSKKIAEELVDVWIWCNV